MFTRSCILIQLDKKAMVKMKRVKGNPLSAYVSVLGLRRRSLLIQYIQKEAFAFDLYVHSIVNGGKNVVNVSQELLKLSDFKREDDESVIHVSPPDARFELNGSRGLLSSK
ncbi:hypothetical protein J6590_086313 [Homalodisca vitripennis]|nr:hypothetical protein J6590_086313 [Homalodisca vitripennis]